MLLGQPTRKTNTLSVNGQQRRSRWHVVQRAKSGGGLDSASSQPPPTKEASVAFDSTALPQNFCIIEDKGTVQDFAKLQLQEIKDAVQVGKLVIPTSLSPFPLSPCCPHTNDSIHQLAILVAFTSGRVTTDSSQRVTVLLLPTAAAHLVNSG